MNSKSSKHNPEHMDLLFMHALQVLSPSAMCAAEAQIDECAECHRELQNLRPVIESLVAWPTDVLRPPTDLWGRLSRRIADETGTDLLLNLPPRAAKPEWEIAAPGIAVKLLATDSEKKRVSMLVRLEPGADYPPHRHADVEELHLLHGELMIDEKKLYPGDYIRAEADSIDRRVWSETGCTCVLITSTEDVIL